MKVGIVLEGGGMRGMFTAGVLDTLMDENIYTDLAIGVSAGTLFGVNYFSNQKGYAFGSNKYYANRLKCSTRTISALIRALIDKGYITVENPKSFRRKI